MIDAATDRSSIRAERRRQERQHQRDDDRVARLTEALDFYFPSRAAPIHVRMAGAPILAGYFRGDDDGRQRLIDAILPYIGVRDVWTNLNPFNPQIIPAAFDRLVERACCPKDSDVLRIRRILVDFDPVRPAKTASTDAQHQAALERLETVRAELIRRGFSRDSFIEADSGNGGHLIIIVDLDVMTDAKLVERFLKALNLRFGDAVVEIDTGVANPGRVVKLPGTIATKGPNTEERPHRESYLLQASATPVVASASLLEAIADWHTEEPAKSATKDSGDGGWPDAEQWATDHNLAIAFSAPWKDGTKYVLQECAFNSEHDNRSALLIQWKNSVITYRCLHNSCSGKGWNELRDLREPGWRQEWKQKQDDATGTAGAETVDVPAGSSRPAFEAPAFPAEAMPGAWGDLVRLWEPWTEAHPASIILPALIICGVSGGEGVRIGSQRLVEYLAVVGLSTFGRKDTGVSIAVDFTRTLGAVRVTYGQPNSGEGIWYRMRDPDGKDPGATDKRLVLIDTEMGGTMAAGHRNGSTVFPAMLSLYDSGNKEALTKNDRVTVTNGTLGYIGLTVPSQFTRHVTHEDRQSGFVQRLLIAAVHRVRTVAPSRAVNPDVDQRELEAIANKVSARMYDAVLRGRQWTLSPAASAYLDEIADGLVDAERPETSRGVAHVVRLAGMYALTVGADETDRVDDGVVGLPHVRAAEAAWRYCSASGAAVFVGDHVVDKVVMLARDAGDGLTRTELFRMLGNNIAAAELDDAIERGRSQGKLKVIEIRTGKPGRRPQRIVAV
ncbi:MAG: hypothetical protein ABI629_07955 [bacterium]